MTLQGRNAAVGERLVAEDLQLTASERRVARALLRDYPAAGLNTVASLAKASSVSGPTVMRFVKSLGFDSFRDFQEALRSELGPREASALSQSARNHRGNERQTLIDGVNESVTRTPDSELRTAVRLLADSGRQVVAVGGDYSQIAARQLVLQLAPVRPRVRTMPSETVLIAAEIADISKGDVWCIFDVRRYRPRTYRIAQTAAERGAKIVLFTDRWLSPIAGFATVVFTAQVESAGPTDTTTPLLAVTEVLCEQVERSLGKQGVARLEHVDPLREAIEPSQLRDD